MTELQTILSAMLDKARRKLAAAQRAFDAGDWDDTSSRAYYAAFHAVAAVLRARNLVYSSHAQTLGAFNRECVLTGVFPREFAQALTRLFESPIGDGGNPSPCRRNPGPRYVLAGPERSMSSGSRSQAST